MLMKWLLNLVDVEKQQALCYLRYTQYIIFNGQVLGPGPMPLVRQIESSRISIQQWSSVNNTKSIGTLGLPYDISSHCYEIRHSPASDHLIRR